MFSAEDFSSIHLSPDDPEEVFDIMESLGTGNYGQVLKARNRQSEEVVAIKQIMLSDRSELQGILREVVILEKCDHRNIVRYFGTYLSMGKLWMAMEYCEGGCVEAIFQDLHHPMPEKLIAYISHEVLCGLQYVHQHRRLHRDIKGANILLTADGQVKLADFGVSTELMHTLSRRNTFIGTVMWMAPEAIMEIDYDDKADLWSLGITVIELAEGAPPNQGMHLSRAIWAIPRMDPPTLKEKDLWSPQMHFFIKRLLTKDRNMRPDAAAMLNDPFVQVENIGTAEEMRELLRQVQERKRLSRNTNHLRRGEFSETATFIQRGSSSGSSSGNSSSESSDGDDSGGGADDSEHRRSSVKSVSKTKEKSSPRTHHHRGAHGSVSEGASAEAHPSAGVVSTAEAAVSAHHHVDAEPLREASLFGAIVPIPLLSTQDMSLDELAHCDGAGDAGLSLHEVQRLIEGESASSATIAPMSRAPDYLLHITRTLQYALQYHQQLPYVRGVRKAEATKAQAMQAKYGTALKTVYRL